MLVYPVFQRGFYRCIVRFLQMRRISGVLLVLCLCRPFRGGFCSNPRLLGRSLSFVVVPGVVFTIVVSEHFIVVGVFLFVSGESAEVFFSCYPELSDCYKIDLNAQIGSRRNLCLVATSLPGRSFHSLLGYATCLAGAFASPWDYAHRSNFCKTVRPCY